MKTSDDGCRSSFEYWAPSHLGLCQDIDPLHVPVQQRREDVVLGQQGVTDVLKSSTALKEDFGEPDT